jgi:DNA-binding MarR family transcriptional regulator
MSSTHLRREALIEALLEELRNTSATSVLFSQVVAEQVGLNPTALECLDILGRSGPITAGRLAELTGLTTGAITGVVDRLEASGYARRERDTRDRRRVIVRPLLEKAGHDLGPYFAPLLQATTDLCSQYSDEDLAVIYDFVTRANATVHEETMRLREAPTPPPGRAAAARR